MAADTAWHIAIVVPARDEEALLPRCLRSVQRAREALSARVTSDLIVVVDGSVDTSFAIAERCTRDLGIAVAVDYGCVGEARSKAVQVALSRYKGPIERCWLANTDADCQVPESWLVDQLKFADAGYAAVAGIIDVDSFEEHELKVVERFRRTYLIHTDGSHPHVHGANLGVRADAYLDAGSWQALHTAEDHDLWKRLQTRQFKCRQEAALKVITSGRRKGRAPSGFAEALAAHNDA